MSNLVIQVCVCRALRSGDKDGMWTQKNPLAPMTAGKLRTRSDCDGIEEWAHICAIDPRQPAWCRKRMRCVGEVVERLMYIP